MTSSPFCFRSFNAVLCAHASFVVLLLIFLRGDEAEAVKSCALEADI